VEKVEAIVVVISAVVGALWVAAVLVSTAAMAVARNKGRGRRAANGREAGATVWAVEAVGGKTTQMARLMEVAAAAAITVAQVVMAAVVEALRAIAQKETMLKIGITRNGW